LESSGGRGFVTEGNVSTLLLRKEHRRVQFLFEVFNPKPYEKKGMSEEEIKELFQSKLKWETWYEPVSHWEHSVVEGGKFSATACSGTGCKFCIKNDVAKKNGVEENKMLPYPMRLRYALPAWVYDFERLLFIKQASQFFEEVGAYVDKHGSAIDFEVYKIGAGLDTQYKSIFLEKAEPITGIDVMLPNELNFIAAENRDFKEFAEEGAANNHGSSAGSFVIDFGDYKDRTLKEIWDSGDKAFLEFLAMKTTGTLKKKADQFLSEMEGNDKLKPISEMEEDDPPF